MSLDMIKGYLPFLLPLVIMQLALSITALVHVLRHPHYKFGNKPLWVVIVLFVQLIGPIGYFVFGRGDE